jgi:rootletin
MLLNDEIERLNGALRDIGYAVLQDAESTADTEMALQHLHLSQGTIAPPRSPKRLHARTSQALAEGTISAVQAALHKYQLLIHDLQVKLQANNDNLTMTKKQLDQCDHTREILSVKVSELTETLDASNHKLNDVFKERDSLQKTLDNVRNEKLTIERAKLELSSLCDNLTSDFEKLQNASGKLQKMYDVLDEDKKMLEMELQRTMKDKDIVEMNLR